MTDNSVFDLIEKAHKSTARNYGDVRLTEFGCGCKILTAVDTDHFVFKEICNTHKTEYEEEIGKDMLDKIILKDDHN